MNIFSVLGFAIATAVLIIGFKLASPNMAMFVDYPSMFIVFGGTFAAAAISFQLNKMMELFKIFISHFVYRDKETYAQLIVNIIKVGEGYRNGETLEKLAGDASSHFFREGLELISDGFLEPENIKSILQDRAKNMNYMRQEDAGKIKTIGKYPPAFGMMGTTIGMIVLLGNLGGADAMKMIGPAMGVCLITTLYGVIVANLIFIPLGDNLVNSAKALHLKNIIILAGIGHIIKKSNPVLIAEELNSFLLPKDRLDWKDALK
jgi:chemotaxis protein MotA